MEADVLRIQNKSFSMSATELTIENLFQSAEWQHKICGLQPTVTRRIRAQLGDLTGLREHARTVLSSLEGLLASPSPQVIVGITRARGSPLCLVCTGQSNDETVEAAVIRRGGLSEFHVIVFCVIDPLDIDSKQATFVPAVEMEGRLPSDLVFTRLYRRELLP